MYDLNSNGNGSLVKTTDYEFDWLMKYGYSRTTETWNWHKKGDKVWADYTLKYSGWIKPWLPLPDVSKTFIGESQPPLFNFAGNARWINDEFTIYSIRASMTYSYSRDLKHTDNLFYGVPQTSFSGSPNEPVEMFKELVTAPGSGYIVLPETINGLYEVVNYYRCYNDLEQW